MEPMQILDVVIKYGAVPVLCVLSWKQWQKIEKQDSQIAKLNEDHKTDIKSSGEEAKGMQQNTLNTINEFTKQIGDAIAYLKNME